MRTVSEAQSKTSLSRDLQFLKRLWKDIRKKAIASESPALVYEEKDLAFRAIRDYLTPDIAECWVDDDETARQITDFAVLIFSRRKTFIKVHNTMGMEETLPLAGFFYGLSPGKREPPDAAPYRLILRI